ncbi:MAG: GumC family protein [Thermodesulfobacteriota bacterium]
MIDTPVQQPLRVSLRDVLFIVFSKLRVLVGTFAVIVALVVGHSFLATPQYQVKGSVLLKPLLDSRQQLHTLERFEVLPVSQQDINSEIQIMTSDTLLRLVVEQLNLQAEYQPSAFHKAMIRLGIAGQVHPTEAAVLYLREKLEIEPVTMSNIIEVRLKGKDPARITEIVNTFLDRYIDRHIEVHRTGGGVDFYSRQTETARMKLLEAENKLKEFQKSGAIIQIEAQRTQNVRYLRTLQENESETAAKIAATEVKIRNMEKAIQQTGELQAVTEEARMYEVMVDLEKALTPILVEKERIAILYPETSVEYQDAQRQVDKVVHRIRNEQKKLLDGMQLELTALLNQKQLLETEIQQIAADSVTLSLKEVELNQLLREVDQNKKNYLLYTDKTEEARIEAQRDLSRVANISVNNFAVAPSTPVYPRKLLMAGLSILAGLLAGIGCAFAAYYLDHTVKRPEDILRWFNIPVFAAIEDIPQEKEEKHEP